MDAFLAQARSLRTEQLERTADKMGLAVGAIEKDFWVCWVLKELFHSAAGPRLTFKGGTSLSKCWGLIERFSEDVDLVVDRDALGFAGDQQTILFTYEPIVGSKSYLRPVVKMEFGARSDTEPNQVRTISPYVSAVLSLVVGDSAFTVRAVDAERTRRLNVHSSQARCGSCPRWTGCRPGAQTSMRCGTRCSSGNHHRSTKLCYA